MNLTDNAKQLMTESFNIVVDGNYVYITHIDHKGEIIIKAEDEGFVVDVWSNNESCVASTYAYYSELDEE